MPICCALSILTVAGNFDRDKFGFFDHEFGNRVATNAKIMTKIKPVLYGLIGIAVLICAALYAITQMSTVHPVAVASITASDEIATTVGRGPLTLILVGYSEKAENAYLRCADLRYAIKREGGWETVEVRLEINRKPGWNVVEIAGPRSAGLTKACFGGGQYLTRGVLCNADTVYQINGLG